MNNSNDTLPTTMAITALGGQGGGVLSTWLVEIAETAGYFAQTTSVPGVAQRTGATVYYLEFFPKALATDRPPVMSLVPVPGNVDIVVAAELMEAARAVERGYVDKNTVCIFSGHRVYSTQEKMVPGNGIVNSSGLMRSVTAASKESIYFDMNELAAASGCHISAVLLGAIAASGALPFARDVYEDAIRASKKAVEANLHGFAEGWRHVEQTRHAGPATTDANAQPKLEFVLPKDTANREETRAILARIATFPPRCHEYLYLGAQRLLDYQDCKYVNTYLDRMTEVLELDEASDHADSDGYELTYQTARYLPLWMGFEDTIRVAERKTRREHVEDARREVRAADGQYVHLAEFMKPRVEEICGTLPRGLAQRVLSSAFLTRVLERFTGDKIYYSTKFLPFFALFIISLMKPWRRSTYRYHLETAEIEHWLDIARGVAENNYPLAVEIIKCQRLIKGYGDTHERGLNKFKQLMGTLNRLQHRADGVQQFVALRDIALNETSPDKLETAVNALPAAS